MTTLCWIREWHGRATSVLIVLVLGLLPAPASGHSFTLSPLSQLQKDSERFQNLVEWKNPKDHDPRRAWTEWMEEVIRPREILPILWGTSDPYHAEARKMVGALSDKIKLIQSHLETAQWQQAFQVSVEAVRQVQESPYPYDEIQLETLEKYFLWSYYMLAPKIPQPIFQEIQEIPNQTEQPFNPKVITLVFAHINYMLWTSSLGVIQKRHAPEDEDRLVAEWVQQIQFWGSEFFHEDIYSEMKRDRLRSHVRTWLVRADESKRFTLRQVDEKRRIPMECDFREAPIPYLIAMFEDVFDVSPSYQAFEDANHRIGTTLLNYLLARELGLVDLQIYLDNYGKGRTRPHFGIFHLLETPANMIVLGLQPFLRVSPTETAA